MEDEFWLKSKENLKAAEQLLGNGLYNASANRAYFAAFQAAIVALAHFGFKNNNNDHTWVQATFNRELIHRRKIFPGKIKAHLLELQNNRNDSDYKKIMISQK